MNPIANDDRRMGLVFSGEHKLVWRWRGGWLRTWPEVIKHAIVDVWNPIACRIWGHSYLCQASPDKLPVCCDCEGRVKPKAGQSVIQEW